MKANNPWGDLALYFFGLASLACLAVSLPATASAMQLFHGREEGIAATLVFEIGAVGSELATLAIPQWRGRLLALTVALLILTTGGNYALGVDTFALAQLAPTSTYALIRASGYGWLLAVVSSAIFPSLLLVFLTAFTARVRMIGAQVVAPAQSTITNTQINIGVLPPNVSAYIIARAAELPDTPPEELAALLGVGVRSVRSVLQLPEQEVTQ